MVMVNVNPGLTLVDVQAVLLQRGAWLRLAPNVWLLRTTNTAQQVSTALQPLVAPSGTVLVSALNLSDSFGWLSQDAWNWIRGQA